MTAPQSRPFQCISENASRWLLNFLTERQFDMKQLKLVSVIGVVSVVFTTQSNARSLYSEASNMLNQIEASVNAAHKWEKMPRAVKYEEMQKAEALAKRADEIFSQRTYFPCRSAANEFKFFVIALNDHASRLQVGRADISAASLYAPMMHAFAFGKDFQACRTLIEQLPEKPR